MVRVWNEIHALGGYPKEGIWVHLTSGMWVHNSNSIPHCIIIFYYLFNTYYLRFYFHN